MSFSLKGKTALVTGAGRGIGRAIATQLADAGASVLLNDLDKSALCDTERALSGHDNRVGVVVGDLTAPSFPDALVNAALDRFGALDIIVNNAGYSWDNVIQKTTDEQFQAMLDIHLVVPFRMLRAAASHIRDSGKERDRRRAAGHEEGRQHHLDRGHRRQRRAGGIRGPARPASSGLTRTMAKEWGRYNVNVNAVGFGMIETRLVQPLGSGDAYIGCTTARSGSACSRACWNRARQRCPLGRLGTPEEAAGAVLFFCSPLSDYVTGEVLICWRRLSLLAASASRASPALSHLAISKMSSGGRPMA